MSDWWHHENMLWGCGGEGQGPAQAQIHTQAFITMVLGNHQQCIGLLAALLQVNTTHQQIDGQHLLH
jgi:hypothetical protein